MRRASLWLIVVAMLLSACGVEPDRDHRQPDPVELVIVLPNSGLHTLEPSLLQAILAHYSGKHHGVSFIVRQPRDYEEYGQDLGLRLDSPMLRDADILFTMATAPKRYLQHGSVLDLSHVPIPPLDPELAALFDDLSFVEGRRASIPFGLVADGLALNVPLLESQGVPVPPVDWTLEDWDRLHAQIGPPPGYGVGALSILDGIVGSFGGQVYNPADGTVTLDSPEGRAALEWLARQVQIGTVVTKGKAGLQPTDIPLRVGSSNAHHGPSVFQPVPSGPGGRSMAIYAGVGAVLATSQHPEVATDFLLSLISDPEVQRMLAVAGDRPLLADPVALDRWRAAVGERRAQAFAVSIAAGSIREGFDEEIRERVKKFLEGELTLDGMLAQLPERVSFGY